jgi:hypothetical protein
MSAAPRGALARFIPRRMRSAAPFLIFNFPRLRPKAVAGMQNSLISIPRGGLVGCR